MEPEWNIEFTIEYYNARSESLNVTDAMFDFVVLSKADHCVNNVPGTFSYWSNFLSPGRTFQALDYPQQTQRLELSVQISRTPTTRY